MGTPKIQLTEWPEDLKDVIDWMVRISFFGKSVKLKDAVEALESNILQSTGLSKGSMEGLFNKVASGLKEFIGYGGNHDLTGEGIGQNFGSSYASSYSGQAKWDGASWNAGEENANTAAKIFLYTMPLLYYGITYTFWQCTRGNWKNQTIPGDVYGTHFYTFLLDMGFTDDKLKNNISGTSVMTKVGGVIDELQKASAGTYPQFLKKLEENAKPNLPQNAYSYSLYALYFASHGYLTTKLPSLKNKELPQTQSDIEVTLKGYSKAVKKLEGSNTQQLSKAYLMLLAKIKEAFNQDPPPPPSSGGAASGGVLGTAVLGGTAAALATNVGGVTTTLKSFIPIFTSNNIYHLNTNIHFNNLTVHHIVVAVLTEAESHLSID
ncbi:variant erythrocyte surface antigen-1 family protein [Babesia caballi]|uniref:Variant erythrocyte surface antigen-1 family protein n=1 Tax=Babesia caballi TaxID=5871 RepID=A0AAV4LY46_BABCB|nr:variant erythrocyte surface antigen-1 family protein [Babesia caballi]